MESITLERLSGFYPSVTGVLSVSEVLSNFSYLLSPYALSILTGVRRPNSTWETEVEEPRKGDTRMQKTAAGIMCVRGGEVCALSLIHI